MGGYKKTVFHGLQHLQNIQVTPSNSKGRQMAAATGVEAALGTARASMLR